MIPVLAAWYIGLMAILFALVCLFMMLVILIQKPKGGGLTGAFGGAGSGAQTAFGAKTGDVLTWFTVACFVAFLLLAMGLTWAIRPPKSTRAGRSLVPPPATQPVMPEAFIPPGTTDLGTGSTGTPPATTQPVR